LKTYSIALNDAEEILIGKIEQDKRKNWQKEERQRWLVREPKCTLCKQKYSDANLITKEHIHPLCIGGKERAHNITALCEKCNKSRNEMMFSVLAFKTVKDLQKRWPANKTSVQEFVIWCHATIFEDITVIRNFPHINESFSLARNIDYPGEFEDSELDGNHKDRFGNHLKSAAKSFFSKFKLAKKRPLNNSNSHEKSNKLEVSCRKCSQKLCIPSDYTGSYKCPKCKFVNGQSMEFTEEKIKQESNKTSVITHNHEITSVEQKVFPVDKFEEIIMNLLPDEPIPLASFAKKVSAYMAQNDYEEVTTTAFLKLFGFPRGFKKALITHLESKLRITGSLGQTKIERIKSDINKDSNEIGELENEQLNKMAHEILSKDVSHVLFSTLSHKKILAATLGDKMNSRLRRENLINKNEQFFSLYGLLKKKGLLNLIKSEFSEQIICSPDKKQDGDNRWHVKLKSSAHLLSLKVELKRMGIENNGVVKLLDFWNVVNQYREDNEITFTSFFRELGIPSKGPIHQKVWRLIERLDLPYSLEGFMIEGQTPKIIIA